MKKLAMNIISMFTMKRTREYFIDLVSGKTIVFYKDKYDTEWMSEFPYYPSKHRVKVKTEEK